MGISFQEDLPGWLWRMAAWRGTLKMPVPPPVPENSRRDLWWSEPSLEEEWEARKWLINSRRWRRPLHWSRNRRRSSSVHPQSYSKFGMAIFYGLSASLSQALMAGRLLRLRGSLPEFSRAGAAPASLRSPPPLRSPRQILLK
ncbi:hypothetical protein MRB53_015144 [Persea americana]|uniref:Uncharacterized protein n=1 Tax=Persea americana TaxID=3435 RepID=A0ACC2KDG8_PERAE|nr:hypothetical protein MRB53_015144 [Persea americana]